MTATEHSFSTDISKMVSLNYLLHLPPGYGDDLDRRWPLVLFMHGAGERGDDLQQVTLYGLPHELQGPRAELPAIVVMPQCPAGVRWIMLRDELSALLDHIEATERVDTDRIYLTGISMGGRSVWALAAYRPDRFAALVPVCAEGEPDAVSKHLHIPTWIFHGAKDEVIPLERSEAMYYALQARGGKMQFTIFHDTGHDVWEQVYQLDELYDWLLAQKRESS